MLFGMLLLGSLPATAQSEKSKTIKKDFTTRNIIQVSHRHGPLIIKNATDGKIHLHAEIIVKTGDEATAKALFDHFDVLTKEEGDQLDVRTNFETSSWNTAFGTTTIKFKDGTKIKGFKDLKVTMTLEVPSVKELKLENRYDQIDIQTNLPGKLAVRLYSGDLKTQNISGDLELELKYGKASVANAGKAVINLYDSKLSAGNLAETRVESKYSEVKTGNIEGALTMDTYDDKWKIGRVNGKLTLQDKYSEFELDYFREGYANLYDADLVAGEAGDFHINESKYSSYRIEKVKGLQVRDSYDDEFRIREATLLSAGTSKYTEYYIDRLSNSFIIGDSYDDKIELENVDAKFKTISLDGKYTDLSFHMADGAQFEVGVEMKYGKFNYPESLLDLRMYKEKDSFLQIGGYVGGERKTAESMLTIKGYDHTILWK